MARNLAIPFSLIVILAGLAPSATSAPGDAIQVAAGAVLSTATNLSASQVDVRGTILRTGPGDLVITAQTIHLWNGSKVLGWDGQRPDLAFAASAVGKAGGRAGGIVLHAATIVIDAKAQVLAGSGGAGATALGWQQARGGLGGAGGSIRLESSSLALRGLLVPGAGGAGGPAKVSALAVPGVRSANATAVGGAGGASGSVLVNGQSVRARLPALAAPRSSAAQPTDPATLCHAVLTALVVTVSPDPCGAGVTVAAVLQTVQDLVDQCQSPQTSASAAAPSRVTLDCAALLAQVQGVAGGAVATVDATLGTVKEFVAGCQAGGASPGTSGCASILALAAGLPGVAVAQVQAILAQCGVTASSTSGSSQASSGSAACDKLALVRNAARMVLDTVTAEVAGCTEGGSQVLTYQGYDCKAMVDAGVQTIRDLPVFLASGGNGKDTTAYYTCNTPKGDDGPNNVKGNGGKGGDACVKTQSDDAGDGDAGSSGPINCRQGGSGGNSGTTASANAVGGNGGIGFNNGGDGGKADAFTQTGNGGDGGSGGTAWFRPNCPGGDGGNAGDAGDATATGGNGGTGLCGSGGLGGLAKANSLPGAGGAGGPGNPAGKSGQGGVAGAISPAAGQGGIGTNSC